MLKAKEIYKTIGALGLILALAVMLSMWESKPAQAQVGGTIYSIEPLTKTLGAIQTIAGTSGTTVTNSADQTGFGMSRAACVYVQTSHTGNPGTVIAIQGKDTTTGLYYNLIQSGSITLDNTPTVVYAGAGVTTGANVGNNVMVPRTWRTTATLSGTFTAAAGKLSCDVQ